MRHPRCIRHASLRAPAMKTPVYNPGPGPALESLEPRLLLAADVILSEIMYQPFTDLGQPEDYGEEFIELYNRGDAPANLLGWQFTDGINFEFPDVTIAPAERLVVAANPNVFHTNYPSITNYVSQSGWEGHLSNSGEQITLKDDTGDVVDRVSYADEGDWSFREWLPDDEYGYGYAWSNLHDGGGYSLELINPAMTNNAGQNWSASEVVGGTPGEPNTVAEADIAPLIRDVEHSPAIPTASEPVTVRGEIDDELTTGVSVTLFYRDDGDLDFVAATMYDDGLHDDGDPADGVYAAEIPARPDGTIVEFYVQAEDAGANSRKWPGPIANLPVGEEDRAANCLYQVDDSFTEDWTPGSQPDFRVIMTDKEWLELDAIEDDHPNSNAQRNATFIATDGTGTDVRYEVGIRNRGNGSRTHNPHNQRLNLPHDRPWQGYTALTLNALRTYSQVIASAVFRYADIPASDTTPVKLLINGVDHADTGVDMYGSYAWLEPLDSDMVANHWPDDSSGNLYKCNDSNGPAAADLDYDGEDPDNYNIAYAQQTNVATQDYSGLIHMLDVLNNAPDETYVEDVAEVIDIEQWVRFLATDTLVTNGEGGLTDGRGDDYAMYQGVEDPRFTLVPYDLDTVLGTGSQSFTTDDIWQYRDPDLHGLERLLSQPAVVQMYYATLLELCDTVFAPETINPLIDEALGGWYPESSIAAMKQFAVERVAYVRSVIADEALSVQTSLPVVQGYPRTTDNTVGLSGTASGAYTRSVLVDGQLAQWDPETGQWWYDDGSGSYEEQVLVGADSSVTYIVPTADDGGLLPTPADPGWTGTTFDDSTWISSIVLDPAGVLLTEIGTGSIRLVEIQNVSHETVDTTGWSVLVNDASDPGGINAVNDTAWSLPASIATGEVLYQTDTVSDHYWGATIDWGATGPGWAMILDDAGNVRDFVAWGYTAQDIASLDVSFGTFTGITVSGQWTGDGAPVGTTDEQVPTVDIADVSPDPRNAAVASIDIVFSEAVTGLDIADLSLTRDGGANLLTAEPVSSADGVTWTLGGLDTLTEDAGTYVLSLTAGGAGITDGSGNPLADDAAETWVVDLTAPTADVVDVTPDPRATAVASIDIVFDEPVTGLDLGDLSLTRDAGANLLTGTEPLDTTDNITWTLGGLDSLTTLEGAYALTLTAGDSGVADLAGNPLAADAADAWDIAGVPPTVDITDVAPDPRTDAVDEIHVVFSEPVSGFDLGDLSLTLDAGANLLTGAEVLSSADDVTWTLSGLANLTAADGTYTLTLTADGSGIEDATGNPLADGASDAWVKYTQVGGWIAYNDQVAGAGTHPNTTTYAGNGTASGELINVTTGTGTGATLTITDVAVVYDNKGSDPPADSDAYNAFDGFVDFEGATGSSLEIDEDDGASYKMAFAGLDAGDAITYDLIATSIRGNNSYTDRWTLVTLYGADAFTATHSLADGVVTSDFNPALGANQVAIWAGDNASVGQGWVAHWTDIDPGTDGAFEIVSEQYTGAIPTSVDASGLAGGNKTYGVTGIRLEEVAAPAPPASTSTASQPPAGSQSQGDDGGFVAYNDHVPDYTGPTHPNTTDYSAMSGEVHAGRLKRIDDGTDTSVTLTVTDAGIHYASGADDPAPGTDAYDLFNGYVDLGSATGNSIEVSGSDHFTYTFSDLDTDEVVTYTFHGTAIRGDSGYTNRWTLVTLEGADAFTDAHSDGDGIVTRATNPALAANQVALWTGDNSQTNQGFVVGWADIDPGTDGVFEVICTQYTGPVPTSVDPGGLADGDKGYGITGIRLEEVAPQGPMSYLKRTGNTDANDAGDFVRTPVDSQGAENPDVTVPFGSELPTTMGLGFAGGDAEYESIIHTDVAEAMENVNASLWARMEFAAEDLAGYDTLTLRMKYDDGFVAYLNGAEVARRNADNPLAWNTAASAERDNAEAIVFEDIDISAFLGELLVGTNVLAIHAQNLAPADADLLLQVELKVSRGQQEPGLGLSPGLNRVRVEAFDGEYGTGNKLDETTIDIWSDTGPMNLYPQAAPAAGQQGATASVHLTVPAGYLPGEPVLVRVEALNAAGEIDRDLWDATATLSADGGIVMDVDEVTLYNGLGSALVTFTGSGPFNLTADVNGFQDADDLTDLTGEPVTTVSGTLSDPSGTVTWSGVVHVTGDVTVPDGLTLSIQPGTLIRIDGVASGTDGADILVQGDLQSLGTEDQPVTFTASVVGENWGEIYHDGAEPSLYQYTNITLGGHSPVSGGHSGTGPTFHTSGSTIVFDHANLTDEAGKVMNASSSDLTFYDSSLARSVMGPETSGTALLFEDSWITDMHAADDADGIYLHTQSGGQEIILRGGVLASVDDDGIDTLGSTVVIEDYIIRDAFDKGVSAFDGEVSLSWCLVIDNATDSEDNTSSSISAKSNSGATVTVNLDHTTIVGVQQAGVDDIGIEARNKTNPTSPFIQYFVTNCIIAATRPVKSDYALDSGFVDIHIDYTNLFGEVWPDPGTGVINADPQFVDAAGYDFRLQTASPSINTGDPSYLPLDDDGSTTDQGRYTNNAFTLVEGELTGNTIWRPEDGQYRITGTLTVPPQYSLTILPGTTVFFNNGTSLIVEGPLYAEGTAEAPVRFTRAPGATSWDGIQFVDNMNDNVIRHAILEHSTRTNGMVDLVNSNLTLESSLLDHADRRRIRSTDSSLIVRDCVFADFELASPENNVNEHIWGGYIPAGGHWIVEGNTFGLTPGHNDAIDFNAGSRPGPIPQILNNTFLGGGDDALDLEGDFHVEGNVFMHYRRDADHAAVDGGESNVISAGAGYDYVVVGNVFYDADHVTLIKDGAFMAFLNNTVVNVSQGPYAALDGAIYFDLIGQVVAPGEGAYVDGSVFANTPTVFNNLDSRTTVTDLTVNRSMLPAAWHAYGSGNLEANPRISNPAGGDFSLANGSPAIGAGPVGQDMGADVARGALLSPAALTETRQTTATFLLAGEADPRNNAILAYRYRLNGGDWSDDQTPGTPIALAGLADGPQRLEVISQNSAGSWQNEADAVRREWTVDTTLARVLINEVLAANKTAHEHELTWPDIIELYNDSSDPVDIGGWSITDNDDLPTKYVFEAGTTIPAEGYLLLYADDAETLTSGIHLDFTLDAQGDDVWLLDETATVVDSVVYGLQIADLSIGRVGPDRAWGLTEPTLDPTGTLSANVAMATGDPDNVIINEWFANGDVVLEEDFVELYNAETIPVHLDGLYLTDNPANQKTKHQFRPLSFIAAEGFQALQADGRDSPGHVDFRLRANMEILGLFDADLAQLERIYYTAQTEDVSQGRTPDGSGTIEFFTLPTPGVANVTLAVTTETLVAETDREYVLVPTGDIGTSWRTDLVYDTTGWHDFQGTMLAAGVGFDSDDGNYTDYIGLDLVEEMDNTNATCYIRIPFTYSGDPASITALSLNVRYDDGFIAYLNGQEIYRENFQPQDTPQWDSGTYNNTTHSDSLAVDLTRFDVSAYIGELNVGDNLLAIHGLNGGASSSDFLISAELLATVANAGGFTQLLALHNDLRITEIMYNPPGSDDTEFIELCNTGTTNLDLEGVRIAGGVDFVLPAVTLAPGEFLVVAKDLAEFQSWYGTEINAVGNYDPDALDNGGEKIILQMMEPYAAAILRFSYDDDWYLSTDGEGASLVIDSALAGDARRAAWRDAETWHPSSVAGGSPGGDDPVPQWALGSVVVNEVLAHSDDPDRGDWIELHNTTDTEIDISGWFLSDDPAVLQKYRIAGDPSDLGAAGNTLIPPGGYVAFTAVEHFGPTSADGGVIEPFALSELGDEVVLSACDVTGALGSYREAVSFGATANSVTLGRYALSTGKSDFVAMAEPDPDPEPEWYRPGTYGYENAGVLIDRLVIEEIMYYPVEGGSEYILLRNVSGDSLPLYDPAHPENTWIVTGGIDYVFPQTNVTVPADGFVLIVEGDPATYLATHNVPGNVQVFGPYADPLNPLSNAGDTITLARPGKPEVLPDPPGGTVIPYITVETIKYSDNFPWPDQADGNGPALARLVSTDYGNEPQNWSVSGAPVLTVDPLVADNASPQLTGTVADTYAPATVTVTVDGLDYAAAVAGAVWTLPAGTLAPLGDGTYDVAVSAWDLAGNRGTDSTVGELLINAAAPTADAWFSATDHARAVGEALLAIPDDGKFVEPRASGVHRLVIQFSEAIDPASFTPAAVGLVGNDAQSLLVDLSSVAIATSTTAGDTVGIIDFAPALPDLVRYRVQLDGVTDAAGTSLADSTSRLFTALAGDVNADTRVDAVDLSYIWPRQRSRIDGATPEQIRSDVTTDGRVNAMDLSAAWSTLGNSMLGVSDPVLPPAASDNAGAALWASMQDLAPTNGLVQPLGPADPVDESQDLCPLLTLQNDLPLAATEEPPGMPEVPADSLTETAQNEPQEDSLDLDLLDVLAPERLHVPLTS